MTEGLEVHQSDSPRSVPVDHHHHHHPNSSLVRRGIPTADEAPHQHHLNRGRTASSPQSADSTLELERGAVHSEEKDRREGMPSREPESVSSCDDNQGPDGELGEEQRQARPPEPPDGGWGWVVVVSTILVLALTLAFPSCIGIFYTDLQTEFSASNSETSWVPAIMTAVLHGGGTVSSATAHSFLKDIFF